MKFRKGILIALSAALLAAPAAFGQSEKSSSTFSFSLSGYVKTDIFYDSRQTVSLREGHYLLYPKEPSLDPLGRDINAAGNFNILSIQTRLAGKITGPDALGAKTSAYIEAEFFGTSDSDLNGFRLRHAWLKLNWKTSELMIGQFWHPMFITESYPEVVSFNTGAPFQPFNRSPQVRFAKSFGRVGLIATALAQRDFTSNGPQGTSSVYLRNAVLPEMNLKLQYSAKDEAAKTESLAGAGIDFMKLVPRLSTSTGYETGASVKSLAGMAYVMRKWRKWTLKAEAICGGNLHHLMMLGGYAVRADSVVEGDAVQDWAYTPTRVLSLWSEAMTNGKRWQTGVFAGYAKNLGARHELDDLNYARGYNIDVLYRVSPRLLLNVGKMRFAAEVELTAASYGTPDVFGKVRDAEFVENVRVLLAAYYFF